MDGIPYLQLRTKEEKYKKLITEGTCINEKKVHCPKKAQRQ